MEYSYFEYSKPFPKEINIQICNDSPAHVGPFLHAIDFLMPEGSKILAPRLGTIVEVKDDSNKGGPSEEFVNDLNFITISHGGVEFSQLCHISQRGSLVKVGDLVLEGQHIGYTGSTGWCYEPHLHFIVFKLTGQNKYGFESLKIRFAE